MLQFVVQPEAELVTVVGAEAVDSRANAVLAGPAEHEVVRVAGGDAPGRHEAVHVSS